MSAARSSPQPVAIDGERLLADLNRLREFGAYQTGVHRPTYSTVDMQSRQWLADRMRAAGLEPQIDGIGNVFGRSPSDGPHVLLGSHTETQNYAGWLDGALGVIYGLEIARVLGRSVDVASWADEEGHYLGFAGSRSFINDLTDDEIDRARSRHTGTPLREVLANVGLAGRKYVRAEPGRYKGYLEAHIEQGGVLEAASRRLGIVTGIVGSYSYVIRFEGVQNHAGTTPMSLRKDAGVALVNLAAAIGRRFTEMAAQRTVWTIGQITLDPGSLSIVPGAAEMQFQFRDADASVLQRLDAALKALVADANRGPCKVTLQALGESVPKAMDATFQEALDRAAQSHAPNLHQRMPSGAGHDAQILAGVMPAGMLFIPSMGGISHHWSENTSDDDIVLGCQVMATAVTQILNL